MIIERSFRVFRKVKDLKWFAAAAAGLVLTGYIIMLTDLTGYARYVPDSQDEVAGVFIGDVWWSREHSFVTNPDIIDGVISAHNEIVSNRHGLRRLQVATMLMPRRYFSNSDFARLNYPYRRNITYLMNDGTLITRMYMIPAELVISSGLNDLARREEIIIASALSSGRLIPLESIRRVSFTFTTNEYDERTRAAEEAAQRIYPQEENFITDRTLMAELYKFIVEDEIRSANNSANFIEYIVREGFPNDFHPGLGFGIGDAPEFLTLELWHTVPEGGESTRISLVSIRITDALREWLDENGYGLN
jgi:hypothetical protein